MKENELTQSYVIVKLKPWNYDEEKAILKELLIKISDELGITKDYKNINYRIDSIIDVIFAKYFQFLSKILEIKKYSN